MAVRGYGTACGGYSIAPIAYGMGFQGYPIALIGHGMGFQGLSDSPDRPWHGVPGAIR
jgi:hypothetical protein